MLVKTLLKLEFMHLLNVFFEFTFPNSITLISDDIFFDCSYLRTVKIGENVTKIGNYSFYFTPLSNINIPEKLEIIGKYAFYYTKLETFTIGENVKFIGINSFSYCEELHTIEVSSNNKYYSNYNNDGILCNKNRTSIICYPFNLNAKYNIPSFVITIEDYAFYCCSKLTSINIGNNVKTIGKYSFSGCSIVNVIIPDSVLIDDNAFCYCDELETVKIGDNVNKIGNMTFGDCEKLQTIEVPSNNKYYSNYNNDGILYDKEITQIISYTNGKTNTIYDVPNKLKIIGECSFFRCYNLITINMNDNVNIISNGAFAESYIKIVNFGNNVKVIGKYAFMGCTQFHNVILPSSITLIDDYAFFNSHLSCAYYNGTNEPNVSANAFEETFVNVMMVNDYYKGFYFGSLDVTWDIIERCIPKKEDERSNTLAIALGVCIPVVVIVIVVIVVVILIRRKNNQKNLSDDLLYLE